MRRVNINLIQAVLCICMALVLFVSVPTTAYAADAQSDVVLSLAGEIADGILNGMLAAGGTTDVQAWADEVLPGMVGAGGEWFAITLRQRDASIDLSAYSDALQRYLRDRAEGADNASVQQRYALALLAAGGGDAYLARVAQGSVGQMGHMSYVYGLHLSHCGVSMAVSDADMIAWLLQSQREDGGWALQGKDAASSDVDVTAMTLQALAPYAQECAAAIEAALTYLSAQQRATGDYLSYGVPCPESGAQVIVALCALGISPDDSRFVKDGVTLIDGILRYRLADGRFSHTEGGAVNTMATVQSLYAMVAIERAADGRGALYDIARVQGGTDLTDPSVPLPDDGQVVIDLFSPDGKLWICVGAVLLSLIACFVLFMRGKRGWKHYLSVAIVCVIAIAAVLLIDIQSAQGYYGGSQAEKENPIGSVTLTIRFDTVAGMEGTEHLGDDGVILQETSFVIEAGDTVFDILREAAAKYGLRIQNTGATAASTAMVYISGINDLHEYDFGDLSGWMYFVNDVSPSVGCGEYVLADGDRIAFRYTRELGDDLK